MKKSLILIGMMLLCTSARAEFSIIDTLQKMPAVKQGVAFSVLDSKINHLSTVDVATWRGFALEAGAAYDAENTGVKAVAVVSYDLLKVKDIVDLPILNLIEFRPGVFVGYGRIEGFEDGQLKGEGDYGVSLTALSLKF